MPNDDSLKIDITVDVPKLKAQMAQAQAVVDGQSSAMAASTQKFTAQMATTWQDFFVRNIAAASKYAGTSQEGMAILGKQWTEMAAKAEQAAARVAEAQKTAAAPGATQAPDGIAPAQTATAPAPVVPVVAPTTWKPMTPSGGGVVQVPGGGALPSEIVSKLDLDTAAMARLRPEIDRLVAAQARLAEARRVLDSGDKSIPAMTEYDRAIMGAKSATDALTAARQKLNATPVDVQVASQPSGQQTQTQNIKTMEERARANMSRTPEVSGNPVKIPVVADTSQAKAKIDALRAEESKPIKTDTGASGSSQFEQSQGRIVQAQAKVAETAKVSADAVKNAEQQTQASTMAGAAAVEEASQRKSKSLADTISGWFSSGDAASQGATSEAAAAEKTAAANTQADAAYKRLIAAKQEAANATRVVREMEAMQAAGVKQSTAFTNDLVIAMRDEVAAKREVAAASEQVAAAEEAVVAATNRTEQATRSASQGFRDMRMMVRGAGQELGIAMPGYMAGFLARLPAVQAAMMGAFNVLLIVGMIEMIPRLIEGIEKAAAAVAGFGEEERRVYEEAVAANSAQISKAIELHDKHRALGEIGLSGMGKISAETRRATATMQEYARATTDAARQHDQFKQKFDKVNNPGYALTHLFGTQGPFTPAHEEAKAGLKNTEKNTESGVSGQQKEQEEIEKLKAEQRRQGLVDANEADAARIKASQSTAEAEIHAEQEHAKDLHTIHRLTAEQMFTSVRDGEDRLYQVKLKGINERLALAKREAAQAGDPGKAARAGIEADAQRTDALIQYHAKLASMDAEEGARVEARQLAEASADIENAQKAANAQIALDEQVTKEKYAAHQSTAREEAQQLMADAQARYDQEMETSRQRLNVLKANPEKNVHEIKIVQQDIDTNWLDRLISEQTAIYSEGQQKQLQDDQRAMEERVRHATDTANRIMATENMVSEYRLRTGEMSRGTWARAEEASLNQWYAKEREALQQEAAFYQQYYANRPELYQQMLDRMAELDLQYKQKRLQIEQQQMSDWDQLINKETETLTSGLNSCIQGHDKFRVAVAKTENQMLMEAIQFEEKRVAHYLAGQVRKLISHVVTNQATTTSDRVAAAQTEATESAAAHRSILKSAKAAAAKVYKALADVPPLAAAAAAVTFAAVMMFAGFEKGGSVGRDWRAPSGSDTVPAMLKPGEHVMTDSASAAIGRPTLDAFNRGDFSALQPVVKPQYAFAGMPTVSDRTPGVSQPQMANPMNVRATIAGYGGAGVQGTGGSGGGVQATSKSSGGITYQHTTHIDGLQALDGASVRGALEEHADLIGDISWQKVKIGLRESGVNV